MLNDVLLVTRCLNGDKEMNFLSTIDEFVDKWCFEESPDICDGLSKVVHGAKPYEWAGYYVHEGNDIFELRFCQGPEDLIGFLAGKYNDSIEAKEERYPGSAGLYNNWYWKNSPDLFSPKAIEAVKEYTKEQARFGNNFTDNLLSVMPDFPGDFIKSSKKHQNLDDVIAVAKESKKSVSNRNYIESVLR